MKGIGGIKVKVISFCVWGNVPLYNYGLWENAMLMPVVFPGWRMRVYYTGTVIKSVIDELSKLEYVDCVLIDVEDSVRNSMLRFLPMFDSSVDVMISRDADSRLLKRDKCVVDAWLRSGKMFHIVRDHPANRASILAGMFGVRGSGLKCLEDCFWRYYRGGSGKWGTDQLFLRRFVYPRVRMVGKSKIHASYNRLERHAEVFPRGVPSRKLGFIGQTYRRLRYSVEKFGLSDREIVCGKRRVI